MRLGLLLSEIGQANGIEVTQQEMQRLIQQAAQQYQPKDRERFAQYIQQDPMAAAQLRAPLYEDKVVDFLFAKAEIGDRAVTREELEAAIESEDGFASGTHMHSHDHDHGDHDHDDHDGHDHGHDHDHDHGEHEHAHGYEHDHAEAKPKKVAARKADADGAEATARKPAARKATPKKAADADETSADAAEKPKRKPAAKTKAAETPEG